jgi:hypothetical protein
MNQSSENRLSKVHPKLAARVRLLIAGLGANGFPFEVVQGLRTYVEQDLLFTQGRTKPGEIVTRARGGYSNHNFGLACDIAPVPNGKIDWNWREAFLAINDEAEKVGLLWGGDWTKFIDLPHVELKGPTLKECRALYVKGGLQAVWAKVDGEPSSPQVPSRPTLKLGDKGQAVRIAQAALKAKGYSLSVDGEYGRITESIIKQFQKKYELPETGIIDEATWELLG